MTKNRSIAEHLERYAVERDTSVSGTLETDP
jgi:hypothetical protein